MCILKKKQTPKPTHLASQLSGTQIQINQIKGNIELFYNWMKQFVYFIHSNSQLSSNPLSHQSTFHYHCLNPSLSNSSICIQYESFYILQTPSLSPFHTSLFHNLLFNPISIPTYSSIETNTNHSLSIHCFVLSSSHPFSISIPLLLSSFHRNTRRKHKCITCVYALL